MPCLGRYVSYHPTVILVITGTRITVVSVLLTVEYNRSIKQTQFQHGGGKIFNPIVISRRFGGPETQIYHMVSVFEDRSEISWNDFWDAFIRTRKRRPV